MNVRNLIWGFKFHFLFPLILIPMVFIPIVSNQTYLRPPFQDEAF